MEIAILGAGNVALATAWFLANSGHDAHVWSAFEAERSVLAKSGCISAEGIMQGEVRVTVAADAKMCLAACPAGDHCRTGLCSPDTHVGRRPIPRAEQDVLVHPVTGLSSLLLSRMLKEPGRQADHNRRFDQPVHGTQGRSYLGSFLKLRMS